MCTTGHVLLRNIIIPHSLRALIASYQSPAVREDYVAEGYVCRYTPNKKIPQGIFLRSYLV